MTRISCDLPEELVARLNRQACLLGTGRTDLIKSALIGLVREFEKIDEEEGIPPSHENCCAQYAKKGEYRERVPVARPHRQT